MVLYESVTLKSVQPLTFVVKERIKFIYEINNLFLTFEYNNYIIKVQKKIIFKLPNLI